MKKEPEKQGLCPRCGSRNLEYNPTDTFGPDEKLRRYFTCRDCNATGREVFAVERRGRDGYVVYEKSERTE